MGGSSHSDHKNTMSTSKGLWLFTRDMGVASSMKENILRDIIPIRPIVAWCLYG